MSNRIRISMESIINNDQKGFMPGRRISANIRHIFDIIKIADIKKLNAIILSLDFQKCFDQISMSAITGSLRFFNFGKKLIKWAEILYFNFYLNVQNNGHLLENVYVKHGVHQGRCCSVNYFLIIAEIIALVLTKTGKLREFQLMTL